MRSIGLILSMKKANKLLRIELNLLSLAVIYLILIFFNSIFYERLKLVDHFFNPSSKDFIHDPVPTLEKLSAEFPILDLMLGKLGWLLAMQTYINCLLDTRLSTDFNLWEYAPPKKPFEEMDAFEKLMNNNLFFLDQKKSSYGLENLALPAFLSKNHGTR